MAEGLSSSKGLCGSWVTVISKYMKHCIGEKTCSGARTRATVEQVGLLGKASYFPFQEAVTHRPWVRNVVEGLCLFLVAAVTNITCWWL